MILVVLGNRPMSQAREDNHQKCVYEANYHHDLLRLLLGKDRSQ